MHLSILLNGARYETAAETIAALLRELELPQQGVAVACNGEVVPRPQHPAQELREGDRIEIICAVQGG